jgi:hypothetical protein
MTNIASVVVPVLLTIMFLGLTISSVLLSSTVYVVTVPLSVSGGSPMEITINAGAISFGALLPSVTLYFLWRNKRGR